MTINNIIKLISNLISSLIAKIILFDLSGLFDLYVLLSFSVFFFFR